MTLNQLTEVVLSIGEILYLALVVFAGTAFAVTLAYYSRGSSHGPFS